VKAKDAANSKRRRVFAAPLCLATASGLGFVAAFLWEDVGRILCWFGIGLPLIVIAWFATMRRGQRPH
jgi:hypothetical protein